MPYKDTIKQKQAQREHYLRNKEEFYERVIRRRKKAREWIDEYKSDLKCIFCGESDSRCLDFHHLEDKDDTIAQMISEGTTIERLKREIDKCDVVCSNCHRVLHYEQRELKPFSELSEPQKRRRLRAEWFNEYKKYLKCVMCGCDNPICFDFHHRDPEQKMERISVMVSFAYSIKNILEEIDKCDVVCSNCHRKIHR